MREPANTTADMPKAQLRDGLVTWATADAPWLQPVDEHRWREAHDAPAFPGPGRAALERMVAAGAP
jgi:hypothetical protein